jgi:hypothetical protein
LKAQEEKKRKGLEKKLLLTISKVTFEGKGGKLAKTKKKKRKGFEKKFLLTISKVNFEGKGGKLAKTKKNTKKKAKRVREQVPFDNFQGQFSRQRKEK